MRQARRAVARLEQDFLGRRFLALDAIQQFAGLLERPGLGFEGGGAKGRIGGHFLKLRLSLNERAVYECPPQRSML